MEHEGLLDEYYEKLLDEYYDREFTNEEIKFFNKELIKRIRSGEELSAEEVGIALDLFYYENGETLEVGRHNWTLVENILKIDENEFYRFNIWTHDDSGDEYEEQAAERVVLKPVEVMKWVEAKNG